MSETCTEAECAVDFNILYQAVRNSSLKAFGRMGRSESIASSAVKTSIDLKAKALVVCSESGATAQQVAKFRPGRKSCRDVFTYCLSISHIHVKRTSRTNQHKL